MSVGPIISRITVDAEEKPILTIIFPPGFDQDEARNIFVDAINYVLEAANN